MGVHSIRTRFLCSFLLVAGGFGGAVLLAWNDVSKVDQTARSVFGGPMQAMIAGRTAQRDFDDLRRHYLTATTMSRPVWEQRFAQLHAKVIADLDRVEATGAEPTQQKAKHARLIFAQWDGALMRGEYVARAKQIDSLAEVFQSDINGAIDAAEIDSSNSINGIGIEVGAAGREIAGAGAVAVAIGLIVMMVLTRGIIVPIERAVKIAGRIADGHFDDPVVIKGAGGNEPNRLLNALMVMRARIGSDQAALFRQNEELEKRASTDKLTGLFNRRKLEELAQQPMATFRRFGGLLSVILLDVDHFKAVNDTHGHDIGDQVLIHIGALLSGAIREADVACRWGGEEFLVMLPGTDLAGAVILADKIRIAIEEHHFPLVGSKTASLGVAQLVDKESFAALVKRADDALYQAKGGGRNRVISSNTGLTAISYQQSA